jgi:hypothetical protein
MTPCDVAPRALCRALHEQCVEPRLVAADIPEDEGWLCPACDAKVGRRGRGQCVVLSWAVSDPQACTRPGRAVAPLADRARTTPRTPLHAGGHHGPDKRLFWHRLRHPHALGRPVLREPTAAGGAAPQPPAQPVPAHQPARGRQGGAGWRRQPGGSGRGGAAAAAAAAARTGAWRGRPRAAAAAAGATPPDSSSEDGSGSGSGSGSDSSSGSGSDGSDSDSSDSEGDQEEQQQPQRRRRQQQQQANGAASLRRSKRQVASDAVLAAAIAAGATPQRMLAATGVGVATAKAQGRTQGRQQPSKQRQQSWQQSTKKRRRRQSGQLSRRLHACCMPLVVHQHPTSLRRDPVSRCCCR